MLPATVAIARLRCGGVLPRYPSTGLDPLRRSRKIEITMTRMRKPNTMSSRMAAFSEACPPVVRPPPV
jgi:hypothetical protein